MLAASLLLAVAPALPPVIADPRGGPSPWQVVAVGGSVPEAGAAGYLLELPAPPGRPDQGWLETAVALAARRVPVVALGGLAPPADILPYVDGFAPRPSPSPGAIPAFAVRLSGVALVVAVADPAGAVAALAAGATSVLVARPEPTWERELAGLLPEPQPARTGGHELATALRSSDLATVVGFPHEFAGGDVEVPGSWYGEATLLAGGRRAISLRRRGEAMVATLPALPAGGVLVVLRPTGAGNTFERVEVSGQRLPSAAEVLARHQRAVARQERLVPRWQAEQRLLVRVWVAQLARSFEVVLVGPAFREHGVGTDWEVTRAWVDGVAWNPDRLPDLPLIEPKRPPVPPLALRLFPSYRYELRGLGQRQGRHCYVLTFTNGEAGGVLRRGTAYIDAASFGLVELEENAEELPGDVKATHSLTRYRPMNFSGELLWLPVQVVADDLLSAFGGTATVHRELELSNVVLDPQGFVGERSAAYARPHRMFRGTPGGIVALVPDGHGGRTVGGVGRQSQRFLIGGIVSDPGLSYPVPFGGLQIQDFNFRGKNEQLRLLVAGVVNDGAWTRPYGSVELSLRAFMQLLPFSSAVWVRGRELKGEELEVQRQSLGVGVAASVGFVRILLDLGVDRWDFGRTDNTASDFVVPEDTFEGVARLEGSATLGAATLVVTGEAGRRNNWHAWGRGGSEVLRPSWQRGRAALVYEKTLFALAKLHLDGEYWTGRNLDRFSAPSPARFGNAHIAGIASNRVVADRLTVVRGSLALPLSPKVRGQAGIDLGWVRDRRSGYEARPLSGVWVGFTSPGPWGTLVQGNIGFPLATPGPRAPALELFLLRPLGHT
jgi:hypothetical protein